MKVMKNLKRIPLLLLCLLLMSCGKGVPQDQYEAAKRERDEYKRKYETLIALQEDLGLQGNAASSSSESREEQEEEPAGAGSAEAYTPEVSPPAASEPTMPEPAEAEPSDWEESEAEPSEGEESETDPSEEEESEGDSTEWEESKADPGTDSPGEDSSGEDSSDGPSTEQASPEEAGPASEDGDTPSADPNDPKTAFQALTGSRTVSHSLSVKNDKTGKWRLTRLSTGKKITEYAVSYYKAYFGSDEEVHAVINDADHTTSSILRYGDSLLVDVHEYANNEENDASILCIGALKSAWLINIQTGAVIDRVNPAG